MSARRSATAQRRFERTRRLLFSLFRNQRVDELLGTTLSTSLLRNRFVLILRTQIRAVARFFLMLNLFVNLLPMNRDVSGRFHTKTNTIASYVHNRNDYIVANVDTLILIS